MSHDVVIDFIEGLTESWQADYCKNLLGVVRQAIPDVEERIQYKKPHFLRNGKYAAVISTSKSAVSFTIFNATELDLPEELFEGPPERKTIKLREGQVVDYDNLSKLLEQASASL